jgi:hypothetical protein
VADAEKPREAPGITHISAACVAVHGFLSDPGSEAVKLIVINYFDWSGTRDALTRWVEAVRSECEKNNVGFMGLYGPSQVKFNLCFIHEVDTQERYHRMWSGLTMPAEVTHQVIHYFWPDRSFARELPRYPPTHFFDVR